MKGRALCTPRERLSHLYPDHGPKVPQNRWPVLSGADGRPGGLSLGLPENSKHHRLGTVPGLSVAVLCFVWLQRGGGPHVVSACNREYGREAAERHQVYLREEPQTVLQHLDLGHGAGQPHGPLHLQIPPQICVQEEENGICHLHICQW